MIISEASISGAPISGTVQGVSIKYEVISEDATLNDTIIIAKGADVTDNITADDSAVTFKGGLIEDGFTMNDTLIVLTNLYESLTDNPTVDDSVPVNPLLFATVPESVGLAETLTINQVLNLFINDGAMFTTSFVLDGETYTGVVLNSANFGVTEYQAFNFNSMARFGGDYYGASTDGVYKMGGDLDEAATISARLVTGISDFGSGSLKRVEYAHLGVRNDGELVLKVTVRDEANGNKSEFWYNMTDTSSPIRNSRMKIGRGLRARYWQFELTNNGGADFELDELTMFPVLLTRRV